MSDDDIESHLATAERLLVAEGMNDAAEILRTSTAEIIETGYDNWDGGTPIYTVYLSIDPAEYGRLGTRRATLEEQLTARLKPVFEEGTGHGWYSATIRPKVQSRPDWRNPANALSKRARRNIIDGLKIDKVSWQGELDDVEFLQRLFDLAKMPSTDGRFQDAAGDIWQHRRNNYDWDDDWVFDDARFNLVDGPAETFLGFLCEMIHPVVRPDRNQALALVQQFNDQLRPEGWILVEQEKIAGRPRYVAKRIQDAGGRSVTRARTVADALDAGWMQKEIERVENAVDSDPALAIGTAKELVESCCKTILQKRGIELTPVAL